MLSTALLVSMMMADAAAVAPVTSPQPPAKNERVICRSYEVTGSLAGSKRVCRTVKEWDDASRAAREAGEKMQDAGRSVYLDPLSGG
jgi:hypothetical protein